MKSDGRDSESSQYRVSLWLFVFTTTAGVAFTLLDQGRKFGLTLLNLSLLQIFIFLSTILHELGHILAARLVGLRVFGIEIGYGRIIADFRFAGLRWQFRGLPFGGSAHAYQRSTNFYRLKDTLFILGGPATNALLVVFLAATREQEGLFPRFTEGLAPQNMLLLANAALLIYSLVPTKVRSSYGEIPNDALLLWQTWRQPKEAIKELPVYWYWGEAEECRLKRAHAQAHRWLDEGSKVFPDNFVLESQRAVVLSDQGQHRSSLRLWVILLARYKPYPNIRPTLLNNIAYAALLSREPGLLATADLASRQALELMPWVPHHKGTRGAVLVKLGCHEEGLRLLHQAFQLHKERADRAICACWLAEAYRNLGNQTQSRRYRDLAAGIDPHCPIIKRLERDALPSQALA